MPMTLDMIDQRGLIIGQKTAHATGARKPLVVGIGMLEKRFKAIWEDSPIHLLTGPYTCRLQEHLSQHAYEHSQNNHDCRNCSHKWYPA